MTTKQPEPLSDAELRRRQIIDQAFLAYGCLEDELRVAFDGPEPLTDAQAIAFSFWDAVMMCSDMREALQRRPPAARCAWCVRAAGDDEAAWQAAKSMTYDEAAAHARVCPHNPVVQELERLRAALRKARSLVLDLPSGVEPNEFRASLAALLGDALEGR